LSLLKLEGGHQGRGPYLSLQKKSKILHHPKTNERYLFELRAPEATLDIEGTRTVATLDEIDIDHLSTTKLHQWQRYISERHFRTALNLETA
jgi:hypothetical protein